MTWKICMQIFQYQSAKPRMVLGVAPKLGIKASILIVGEAWIEQSNACSVREEKGQNIACYIFATTALGRS